MLGGASIASAQDQSDDQTTRAGGDGDGISLSRSEETLFRADEVVNHSDLGVTVLRGNVEIAQAGYVLTADTVSYNREADTLTASGDVVLMHPDGTVMFSTYTEITSDGFKNGVIENIRILLDANTRVAANGARRSDGNTTEMSKGVYSPCDVCREDASQPPLWQVTARRITHDEEDYLLKYEDMWLEVAGVPILYAPYFQHYDPRVERKSGLLTPSFGSTSGLDRFVQPRYFWAIGPDQDFLAEPIIGSSGDAIAAGRYRQAFDTGELEMDFSLGHLGAVEVEVEDDSNTTGTETTRLLPGEQFIEEKEARGHIRGHGVSHLNETWRAGFDIVRTTDISYHRAYPLFALPDTRNVSTAYVEGFRGRNYANGEMISIQSLRVDEPVGYREQDVLPLLEYYGMGEADRFGGRWQLESQARFLAVEDDDDLHRFTVTPGYGFSKISDYGFKTDFLATMQANGYVIERDGPMRPNDKSYDTEAFVLPKASMRVTYPFMSYGEQTTQTITPILFGSTAPDTQPSDDIVFEDSTRFEQDELTVFSHDLANGNDVAVGGSRVAAGGRYLATWQDNLRFDATLARVLAATRNDDLKRRLGVGKDELDWVGRIAIDYDDYLGLEYRFRTGEFNTDSINRQEFNWAVGPSILRFGGNYTFLEDSSNGPTVGDSEFVSAYVSSSIGANWSFSTSASYDITAEDTRAVNSVLQWQNECTIVRGNFTRSYTTDANGRDIIDDTFLVTLSLLTLGEQEFSIGLPGSDDSDD